MKYLLMLIPFVIFGQNQPKKDATKFQKDSLIIVTKNENKGFLHDYILFIPKGTQKDKKTHLLVETNNTGKTSDSIEDHKQSAIALASISSIGNNISTELKIPLLVPIFPRPQSKELVYTHALDRDVILEKTKDLKRLDLQLISMIKNAQTILKDCNIIVDEKIFMNGFSASGSFTNRFLFLHPNLIKAAAMGGLNGELMLPLKQYKNTDFNYPLGINDLKKITRKEFDRNSYLTIPQFIYMGALDNNDAIQFDDAYNTSERNTINSLLGETVQERWKKCQDIYKKETKNVKFSTYENVGHWTTSNINLEIILFFNQFLNK